MFSRPLAIALLVCSLALIGCSRREQPAPTDGPLTFEELETLSDTTGLSRGPDRFRALEVARGADGIVRARGAVQLPDGTVGQLLVYGDRAPGALTRLPFRLRDGRFEGVEVRTGDGPLPPGRYRFEVTVLLDPTIQSEAVMRALGDPARLRGPGITRNRVGGAAFTHLEEFQL